MVKEKGKEMNKKTRIYTVFSSSGLQGECRIHPIYHPDKEVLTNEKILDEIKGKCKDVEFVGEMEPKTAEFAIANIRNQRGSLDGVLYFGAPTDELIVAGLPIIAVYPLWGQWMPPFNAYNPYSAKKYCKFWLNLLPIKRLDEI